ncbi:MAG: ADP-ribosylglycohydrolase family protein [Clostridia bacterium]|nr:ADP-ribosylglycohydrolase family protein [Clostridia bacterium]
MNNDFLNKIKAVAIGHAVADALGVPVEFSTREELRKKPVTDMMGYGTFNMPKGSWSDDTSMALCALDAMGGEKLNFKKTMQNFVKWCYGNQYTPTGFTFDIGGTCRTSIAEYLRNPDYKTCGPKDERSNGNGSLMRIYPFVIHTYLLDTDVKTKLTLIYIASALTHAHKRSKIACAIYAFIMWELLGENTYPVPKEVILKGMVKAKDFFDSDPEFCEHYKKLFQKVVDVDEFLKHGTISCIQNEDCISSGGYVVDTLEAAIWCLLTTSSYKECVLKAVNLGSDTDTVGAIAGSLAGATYGYEQIPLSWREALIGREYIESLCDKAFAHKIK